jgi:hypothetical protein
VGVLDLRDGNRLLRVVEDFDRARDFFAAAESAVISPWMVSVVTGCSGSLVYTETVLAFSPIKRLVSNVALIVPSWPGGITSAEITAAVQPQEVLIDSMRRSCLP